MRLNRVQSGMAGVLMIAGLPACSQLPGIPFGSGPEEERGPAPEAAPTERADDVFVDAEVCVVDASLQGGLRTLRAKRDRRTGEIYVMAGGKRQPLERVHPAVRASGYADGVPWFESEAPIRLHGGRYHRYGPERVVPAGQLRRGEAYDGILVFLDPQDTSPPAVVYVPARAGCVFQPYVREEHLRDG